MNNLDFGWVRWFIDLAIYRKLQQPIALSKFASSKLLKCSQEAQRVEIDLIIRRFKYRVAWYDLS